MNSGDIHEAVVKPVAGSGGAPPGGQGDVAGRVAAAVGGMRYTSLPSLVMSSPAPAAGGRQQIASHWPSLTSRQRRRIATDRPVPAGLDAGPDAGGAKTFSGGAGSSYTITLRYVSTAIRRPSGDMSAAVTHAAPLSVPRNSASPVSPAFPAKATR